MTVKEFKIQYALGSMSKAMKIKLAITIKSSARKEILTILSNDNSKNVRYWVANNSNTPKEILVELSKDKDFWVELMVSSNRNTPIETLKYLKYEGTSTEVRHTASNTLLMHEGLIPWRGRQVQRNIK